MQLAVDQNPEALRSAWLLDELARCRDLVDADDPQHRRARRRCVVYEKRARARRRTHERRGAKRQRYRLDDHLACCVGMLWDDAYAMLCRRFRRPNARERVMSMLHHEVKERVVLIDERPHPEFGQRKMMWGLYVCPATGRLKEHLPATTKRAKHPGRLHLMSKRGGREVAWRVDRGMGKAWRLEDGRLLIKHEGRWWCVTLTPVPPREVWGETQDVRLGVTLATIDERWAVPEVLDQAHFLGGYASSMRPLTDHEVHQRGLTDRAPGKRGRVCRRRMAVTRGMP